MTIYNELNHLGNPYLQQILLYISRYNKAYKKLTSDWKKNNNPKVQSIMQQIKNILDKIYNSNGCYHNHLLGQIKALYKANQKRPGNNSPYAIFSRAVSDVHDNDVVRSTSVPEIMHEMRKRSKKKGASSITLAQIENSRVNVDEFQKDYSWCVLYQFCIEAEKELSLHQQSQAITDIDWVKIG